MCSVDVTADVGRDNAPGDDENDKLARHDPHAASAGPGMCHQPAWAERRGGQIGAPAQSQHRSVESQSS